MNDITRKISKASEDLLLLRSENKKLQIKLTSLKTNFETQRGEGDYQNRNSARQQVELNCLLNRWSFGGDDYKSEKISVESKLKTEQDRNLFKSGSFAKKQIDLSVINKKNSLNIRHLSENKEETNSIKNSKIPRLFAKKEAILSNEKRKEKFEELFSKGDKEGLFKFFIEELEKIKSQKLEEKEEIKRESESTLKKESAKFDRLFKEKLELEKSFLSQKEQIKFLQKEIMSKTSQIHKLILESEEKSEIIEKLDNMIIEKMDQAVQLRNSHKELEGVLKSTAASLEAITEERNQLVEFVQRMNSFEISMEGSGFLSSSQNF